MLSVGSNFHPDCEMPDPQKSDPQKLPSNTNRQLHLSQKYRNIVWTWNNPDDVHRIVTKLQAWKGVTYCSIGEEVGAEGTSHLQGYTEFTNQKLSDTIQKMLENNHFEARYKRATAAQAASYTKKGMQPKEEWEAHKEDGPNYGLQAIVYEWGQITTQGERNDLTPACQMIKEGASLKDVAMEHPECFVKYHKGLQALKAILIEPRDEVPEIKVYYGGTGSFKSWSAREWLGYAKSENPPYIWNPQCKHWFDGYQGEKKAIFEEFRGQIPFGFLLILTDRYDCKCEYKGGITEFAATKIAFTSPIHPREWYKLEDLHGNEKLDQLLRRITTIVNMDEMQHKRKLFDI